MTEMIRGIGTEGFEREIAERFGMVPNFFRSAPSAPGLIEELWAFAKSAYLDSTLPSLFKERLFVHLSRFCETRYCVIRHVGFLLGEGRPAGDARAAPETVADVVALLGRPLPDLAALDQALTRLEAHIEPIDIPEPRSQPEADLFDALTTIFVAPSQSVRARGAVRTAVGDVRFEVLAAFLTFVRTAHHWSEMHPELAYEPDVTALMQKHPDLAALLLDTAEARRAEKDEALRREAELAHAQEIGDVAGVGVDLAPGKAGDITELKSATEHQQLLLAELQHRVRNMLAVIRSIVRRTAESSETIDDFANHLDGRIGAFARVQVAVSRDPLTGFDLAELISEEFRACAAHEGKEFTLEGPPVRLKAKTAESLGLAIHELATNAVKHGAFTSERGHIQVRWWKEAQDGEAWLAIDWTESGMLGHRVTQSHEGFGTRLLQEALQYELGAKVTRFFEPSGFRCVISLPLDANAS
jgi:two-component sensor histidine kinase